jgi:hypothetical protein
MSGAIVEHAVTLVIIAPTLALAVLVGVERAVAALRRWAR